MDVLLSKKPIEIRLFPEYKCLEWEWKEPTTQKNMKKFLEKVYDYFKSNSCDKITNIMQNMGVLPQDLMMFVNTDWMPRMIQAGLKYVSLVVPKSASADYTVEKLKDNLEDQRSQSGVEEATFTSIEEARGWIASR